MVPGVQAQEGLRIPSDEAICEAANLGCRNHGSLQVAAALLCAIIGRCCSVVCHYWSLLYCCVPLLVAAVLLCAIIGLCCTVVCRDRRITLCGPGV